MNPLFSIQLPKWPALAVFGKPIHPDIAAVAIIRLSGLNFYCNDSSFLSQINSAVGITKDKFEQRDKACEEYRAIHLNYLCLSHRVASCWVGGTHGWLNWDGNVFSNNYNIGKCPNVKDVYDDWKTIAGMFPMLDLTAQLFSGEVCEPGIKPLVEFRIKNRRVKLIPPKTSIHIFDDAFVRGGSEVGCTIEQFKDALEKTKEYNKDFRRALAEAARR